jgi:hypothetical protein
MNLPAPEDIKRLGGISDVYGYVIDKNHDDIIIVGSRVVPFDSMSIDDLVVALRSSRTPNEPPSCSIDPRPEERYELQKLSVNLSNYKDDEFVQDKILSNWQKSLVYQTTRISGIPKNCSFAKTLIDADYLMKKISNGDCRVPIRGFKSFSGMLARNDIEQTLYGNGSSEQEVWVRFWFVPNKSEVFGYAAGTFIQNSSVKLLTEEQFWTASGELKDKGYANPFAEKFVREFSNHYFEAARAEPLYAKLQFLFRLVLLRDILAYKGQLQCRKMDFYLHSYSVCHVIVPDSLPAIHSFRRVSVESPDCVHKFIFKASGGVEINHTIDRNTFITDVGHIAEKIAQIALAAKGTSAIAFWNFQLPEELLSHLSVLWSPPKGNF